MDFDRIFNILGNEKFLHMEGLGNEVPFFVHAYDIIRQVEMYKSVHELVKRLETSGIKTLLIGLYDMVIEHFKATGELEELFEFEKHSSKTEFLKEMASYTNPDDLIKPYFQKRMQEDDYRLVMVYRVGEVFPFMRTHTVLNNLQSTVTGLPLVVFFPGEYETSPEAGFKLNLFGLFPGPYYRAFKLEDYIIRGKLNG